ncbi:MAG: aldo/keto reductase [Methanomassiliicoccales archaeon]
MIDGRWIPLMGYSAPGTAQDQAALREAMEVGYRHLDLSLTDIGMDVEGLISGSSLTREEVFVTFTVSADPGLDLDDALDRLGLGHLDLVIMESGPHLLNAWRVLEGERGRNRTRSVGVAGLLEGEVQELLARCSFPPVVNRVKCHPHLVRPSLKGYLDGRGILMAACSPLKGGAMRVDRAMATIGWRQMRTAAQATLRWHLQRGVLASPVTSRREHMEENRDILDFCLGEEDMRAIASLDREGEVNRNPD